MANRILAGGPFVPGTEVGSGPRSGRPDEPITSRRMAVPRGTFYARKPLDSSRGRGTVIDETVTGCRLRPPYGAPA